MQLCKTNISVLFFCLAIPACSPTVDFSKPTELATGENATKRIVGVKKRLPGSARNLFYCSGGSFNGGITYWCFECGSLEDCWQALNTISKVKRDDFLPWRRPRFAVVMDGPQIYWKNIGPVPWRLGTTSNGAYYEEFDGERLKYFAIDFDSLRVYGHFESGGFPQQPPSH